MRGKSTDILKELKDIEISELIEKELLEKKSKVQDKVKEDDKKDTERKKHEEKSSISDLLKEVDKKDKKERSKIKADYSDLKPTSYSEKKKNSIYKTESLQKSYTYEGNEASGVFVPKLQTFYESDSKHLHEMDGYNLARVEAISWNDMKEKQRAGKMNVVYNVNYVDPDIDERYKHWILFSFNLSISIMTYNSIGS